MNRVGSSIKLVISLANHIRFKRLCILKNESFLLGGNIY